MTSNTQTCPSPPRMWLPLNRGCWGSRGGGGRGKEERGVEKGQAPLRDVMARAEAGQPPGSMCTPDLCSMEGALWIDTVIDAAASPATQLMHLYPALELQTRPTRFTLLIQRQKQEGGTSKYINKPLYWGSLKLPDGSVLIALIMFKNTT